MGWHLPKYIIAGKICLAIHIIVVVGEFEPRCFRLGDSCAQDGETVGTWSVVLGV